MAEYFVSYTSSDRAEALWIAEELRKLGHAAHVHEWEIRGGDDIVGWMQTHMDEADHALCVVSDAYLRAPYSTLERNAALWANATRPGFALFVVVKPCRLPVLADHYRRCDISGLPEPEARARLTAFLAEPDKGTAVPLPQATALSNIPVRVPEHFLGRDDALAAVDAALKRYAGRVAITAVHGLRGVGKTTLAAAYALRHARDYRATWWIRAQSADGMRADLVGLGVRLGWVAPEQKEVPAFEKVEQRLRHEGEGLLLIYDNALDADSLRPFLPKGGAARVLVTSNAHAWRGLAEPVELRLWPREIGADYFVARLGGGAREEAEALSEALGGLPLAHEQAAAYCERLGVGLGEYRRRFDAAPIRLLDAAKDAPAEYQDKLTVAKTFALAIEEAGKLHACAEPLIVAAALLAPEPIPLFLFIDGREALGEPLTSGLADDGLEEALAALRMFALVDLEEVADERDASIATKCFRLHRLVQMVAGARRKAEAPRSGLLGAMEAAMEESGDAQNARSWPRLRRLAKLAEALIESRRDAVEGDLRVANVCDRLALFQNFALAAYASARPLFDRALTIREKTLGPEHLETATSLNNLALLLKAQGGLAGARPLYERALAICEKALGPEHPDTAAILNNFALLLKAQGDFAGARPHYERALAICEKALGPEHPDTAMSLNNLASLLQAQGDIAGARSLYERALAIQEKASGPEHPDKAAILNNLALLLQIQGDLSSPEPYYLRAVEAGEKALGADHPLAQRIKSSYAGFLTQTARAAQALPLAQAALAVHSSVYGPDHPWTKDSARAVAKSLDALGRADEAAAVRSEHGV